MNQVTLHTLAREMLRETNVYNRDIERIVYSENNCHVSLVELVEARLSNYRGGHRNRSESNFRIVYNAIQYGMEEYLERYPAPFSFKQRVKQNFSLWLECIREKYGLSNTELPEGLQIIGTDNDTAIAMLKVLHNRDGITKEGLGKELGISQRSIQKNLRKLSPGMYEGNSEDFEEEYVPFRIGGQPVLVDIETLEKSGSDKKKYYRTRNTVHPIVLQENLMQVGTILKSLCHSYYERDSRISVTVALDIWSQLSEYAKERLRFFYAIGDLDFQMFLEELDDECPDDRAVYRTEKEMVHDIVLDIDMPVKEALVYLIKGEGRRGTLVFNDGSEAHRQQVFVVRDANGACVYEAHGPNGTTRVFAENELKVIVLD